VLDGLDWIGYHSVFPGRTKKYEKKERNWIWIWEIIYLYRHPHPIQGNNLSEHNYISLTIFLPDVKSTEMGSKLSLSKDLYTGQYDYTSLPPPRSNEEESKEGEICICLV